jgi:hypothetical protein
MPFKSKAQMKACFATNGFNGKIDCDEWAKDTDTKSLPDKKKEEGGYNMYRPKDCKKCGGKMQRGGEMYDQRQRDEMRAYLESLQNQQLLDTAPPPIADTPQMGQDRIAEGIQKGIIQAPQGYNPNQFDYTTQNPAPTPPKNPYQTLQNVGIGIMGARTALGFLSGAVERRRQNQYDYTQQTALGQMNPMQASDFQPNPYSLYAKYGGNLKTIMKDFERWSNDAKMDFGSGDDDKGMMKKGGFEIDRMLIVRKLLPELLNFGRLNHSYKRYKEDGGTAQTGGRPPIYTQDRKDPRLQMYNDSLALNISSRFENAINDKVDKGRPVTDAEMKRNEYLSDRASAAHDRLVAANGEEPQIRKIMSRTYIRPDGTTYQAGANLFYDPVQPIIYGKPPVPPMPKDTVPIPDTGRKLRPFQQGGTSYVPRPSYSMRGTSPKDSNLYRRDFYNYLNGDPRAKDTWDVIVPRDYSPIPPNLYDSVMNSWSAYADAEDKLFMIDEQNARNNPYGPAPVEAAQATKSRIKAGLPPVKKKGGIHIKPENKGKFTEYCGGKVTDECIQKGLHSDSATIRKRANFARNARKWN